MLGGLDDAVDAWFLDGFAPDRNPEMWSDAVVAEIKRLSGPGTLCATYTVAGAVRRRLAAAGFALAQRPGFGAKRACLAGEFTGPSSPPRLQPWFARTPARPPGHAAIVGAGVAGCSAAAALIRRGWRVSLIDRHGHLAAEASGNPIGVVMPRLASGQHIEGRFHAAAWRYACATFAELEARGHDLGRRATGALHLAPDAELAARFRAIAAEGFFAEGDVSVLDAAAASARAGLALAQGAVAIDSAGALHPPALCAALAGGATVEVAEVAAIAETASGVALRDASGAEVLTADVVVMATALGVRAFDLGWLPLTGRRGQISLIAATPASRALRMVLAGDSYLTPADGGQHCIGATFDWIENPAPHEPVTTEDHARNRAAVESLAPGLLTGADIHGGRAAVRCMSPDHLPVIGPVPDAARFAGDYAGLRHGQHWRDYPPAAYRPNTFVLTGLGARGLTTAPLAGEILACHITGEPMPVGRDLMTAVHPARFLVRALKRLEA
jgi:tRNA 5-methylaminomethyl-2-thiouridine biosynthesis bifunctional protein